MIINELSFENLNEVIIGKNDKLTIDMDSDFKCTIYLNGDIDELNIIDADNAEIILINENIRINKLKCEYSVEGNKLLLCSMRNIISKYNDLFNVINYPIMIQNKEYHNYDEIIHDTDRDFYTYQHGRRFLTNVFNESGDLIAVI